jgi:hypothetical protein
VPAVTYIGPPATIIRMLDLAYPGLLLRVQ